MPNLKNAYDGCLTILKPQKQGTCGLYSFWYATLLLNFLNPVKKPIVYPRKREGAAASGAPSLRKMAKEVLDSGQGELLTHDEVALMILAFGWSFEDHTTGGPDRATFITNSLAKNQPVMFPYIMSAYGLLDYAPQQQGPWGPHWSLIIRESGDRYYYIEPNNPLVETSELKTKVLRSNEVVDGFGMVRLWGKPNKLKAADPGVAPLEGMDNGTILANFQALYDVNPARQSLANLLFAVT